MSGRDTDDDRTRSRPRSRLLRWLFGVEEPESSPAALPERVGRYRVVDQIGEGGMGRVLLAEDDSLRRKARASL